MARHVVLSICKLIESNEYSLDLSNGSCRPDFWQALFERQAIGLLKFLTTRP